MAEAWSSAPARGCAPLYALWQGDGRTSGGRIGGACLLTCRAVPDMGRKVVERRGGLESGRMATPGRNVAPATRPPVPWGPTCPCEGTGHMYSRKPLAQASKPMMTGRVQGDASRTSSERTPCDPPCARGSLRHIERTWRASKGRDGCFRRVCWGAAGAWAVPFWNSKSARRVVGCTGRPLVGAPR